MYDSSRMITIPFAAATALGSVFNEVTGGVLKGFLGAAGVMPSKADSVAEAVVEALTDENVKGLLETRDMEELAQKAWRKSML
jgi:2-phosphoglycerate kinase